MITIKLKRIFHYGLKSQNIEHFITSAKRYKIDTFIDIRSYRGLLRYRAYWGLGGNLDDFEAPGNFGTLCSLLGKYKWCKGLAPDRGLQKMYTDHKIDYHAFKATYIDHINMDLIEKVIEAVISGKNIMLICGCQGTECHRVFAAEMISHTYEMLTDTKLPVINITFTTKTESGPIPILRPIKPIKRKTILERIEKKDIIKMIEKKQHEGG